MFSIYGLTWQYRNGFAHEERSHKSAREDHGARIRKGARKPIAPSEDQGGKARARREGAEIRCSGRRNDQKMKQQ
jgi:hypothetical protein